MIDNKVSLRDIANFHGHNIQLLYIQTFTKYAREPGVDMNNLNERIKLHRKVMRYIEQEYIKPYIL